MDILKGICKFFENKSPRMTLAEKSQLQSASVLQISFAMRQGMFLFTCCFGLQTRLTISYYYHIRPPYSI